MCKCMGWVVSDVTLTALFKDLLMKFCMRVCSGGRFGKEFKVVAKDENLQLVFSV